MSSLQGQSVQTTYPGLIKTVNNAALSLAGVTQLSDGTGQLLPLSVYPEDPNNPGFGSIAYTGIQDFSQTNFVPGLTRLKPGLMGANQWSYTDGVTPQLQTTLVNANTYGFNYNTETAGNLIGTFFFDRFTNDIGNYWVTLSNTQPDSSQSPYDFFVVAETQYNDLDNVTLTLNKRIAIGNANAGQLTRLSNSGVWVDSDNFTGFSYLPWIEINIDWAADVFVTFWALETGPNGGTFAVFGLQNLPVQ